MTEPESRGITKIDCLLIALLVALVLPLRLWLLHNTEVTARDSIGYIRYALDFENETLDWKGVLKKHHQHPGYPLLVWLVSLPVRGHDGTTTPDNMELSAQLVNLLASLVLIVPMYFLGRQFLDRKVSFLGTLLYQYLPISAHHLSDGISEPVYLVLLVSALLQMTHAVQSQSIYRAALCGFFTGLAYLTRPEGLLVLPAFALVLIVMQMRPAWRRAWRPFFACGAAVVLSAMLVGSIYVYATGKISNKPTVEIIKQKKFLTRTAPADDKILGMSGPMPLFAYSFPPTDHRGLRIYRSIWALIAEINQGFYYLGWIPLLGVWCSFASFRDRPGYWSLLAFGAVLGSVLIALAMSVNYISDRHVMFFVLTGSYLFIFGLQEGPRRLLAWFKKGDSTSSGDSWQRLAANTSLVLLIALMGICVPKAAQRLHGNRAGNHAAGQWLAEHARPGDHIEDDHQWSLYFAGFVFRERETPLVPKGVVPTCYIVTTRSRESQIKTDRSIDLVTPHAKVVYTWPENSELENARVVVYAQPRDYQKNPWHIRSTP